MSQEARQRYDRCPPELRRFLDEQGRIASWPSKKNQLRQHILVYLASLFETERFYNEKQVNAILVQHVAAQDFATLRRTLCDLKLLQRERDGSRYWRVASVVGEV